MGLFTSWWDQRKCEGAQGDTPYRKGQSFDLVGAGNPLPAVPLQLFTISYRRGSVRPMCSSRKIRATPINLPPLRHPRPRGLV